MGHRNPRQLTRRYALALSAALATSCGGDSGPSTTPVPPRAAPLIALAWVNVPPHLSLTVGSSRQVRLTLTATVSAHHAVESDHSRVTITSDRINGGIFTATVRGSVAGSDTVRLTASAPGYETAEASFTVTVARPREPPPRPVPNDPRFQRAFWRQLVFNAHDCPRAGSCPDYYADGRPSPSVEERFIAVLPTTSPNFYIRTHDDAGSSTFASYEIATIYREIPRFVEALTGHPYRGQILTGEQDLEEHGWITITEVTTLDDETCGRAGLGWLAGRIELSRYSTCSFADLVGHEVGHAMGFWHVGGLRDLMYPEELLGGANDFSARERYHAQVAYQLGRGHRYTDGRLTAAQERRPDQTELPVPSMIACPHPGRAR